MADVNGNQASAGYDNVAPDASAMIESMRAYGYTLATAIADLVDNSIAAGCQTVWLDAHWDGTSSHMVISDDGSGMPEAELRDAMRLGSRNPRERRDPSDLGRFGLGLKTASLSQCRRLTVTTMTTPGKRHTRRWDLDHLAKASVAGWQLLHSAHPDSAANLHRLEALQSGTAVVWEILDRVVGDADSGNQRVRSHFLKSIEDVEEHLAMVFHRYLAGPRSRLKIFVNDHPVIPWDPFLESHTATESTPTERIQMPGHASPILVRGFILPHLDKQGPEQHAAASGPRGWNDQQGFYLYRNERLIVPGSWLGLGGRGSWTKEEHYKLARIRLDIPNSMDELWHLDVKKSSASPPPLIRDQLRGLAQTVRKQARSVFAHRGKYGARAGRKTYQRPWLAKKRNGNLVYIIDRKHPMVESVLAGLDKEDPTTVDAMLRIIEETVPVQQIWLDAAERPDEMPIPFSGTTAKQRQLVIKVAYEAVRRNRGVNHSSAVELLLSCEEHADDEGQAIIASIKDKSIK